MLPIKPSANAIPSGVVECPFLVHGSVMTGKVGFGQIGTLELLVGVSRAVTALAVTVPVGDDGPDHVT